MEEGVGVGNDGVGVVGGCVGGGGEGAGDDEEYGEHHRSELGLELITLQFQIQLIMRAKLKAKVHA